MKTLLLTGATQGLGLHIARACATLPDVELVLAVRDMARGEAVAASLPRARAVRLDLSSLDEVQRFVQGWREPIWALVNNAGGQTVGPTVFTPDGFEQTLAVNHLAPTWLTLGLLPQLDGARVIGIGSGTHNPTGAARLFGFRGGRFSSIAALARGEMDATSDAQRGRDRYATSKLLVTSAAMELARRYPRTTFATLDPGLMPGTGLARTSTAAEQWLWRNVLPHLTALLPDASSTERSADAMRWLLTTDSVKSGEVYDFEKQPSRRVWPKAREPALGRDIVDQTIALLAPRWPLPTSS